MKTPTITTPSSKVNIDLTAGSVEPAMKAAGASSAKMFMVPADKVREIDGFNVRVQSPDYQAHVAGLADLIRQNGFDRTKPLSGYVGKEGDENVIFVTDGHTRLAAVKAINADDTDVTIDKLPVVVHAADISVGELTERLHTANNGRPLSPFELGVVVKRRLKDEGVEKATLATRLGVTPRYLDDVLLLVNSPKKVRDAVLSGTVSSTMAIQELRKAGDTPDKAVERITEAVEKATASGKTKATAKDVGVRMQRVKSTVSIATGTDMKEIVKAVAAKVREAIAVSITGEGDDATKLASVDGTISIVIEVPAPEKAAPAPKAKPAAKPAAKKPAKPAAKPAAAPAPEADKPAAKKPAAKKAKPAKAPVEENISADADADDAGLEIEGAEEVTSEGQDDEVAILPPKVEADEEVDI